MLKLSKAPMPADAIGLAEAFERVCETRIPDWHEIQTEKETASQKLIEAATGDHYDGALTEVRRLRARSAKREFYAKRDADRILREALANRTVIAKIEDPRTGEPRPINDVSRWRLPENSEHEPGFRSDYVEPWDINKPMPEQPGPPTCFADPETLHRVFLRRTEFEDWLTATEWDQIVAETEVTTPKQKHMRLALLDEWPSGRVPRLSIPEIVGRITESYRSRMKRAGITDGPPTDSTVRRLIGREKKSDK
jgi:hypothetical protein